MNHSHDPLRLDGHALAYLHVQRQCLQRRSTRATLLIGDTEVTSPAPDKVDANLSIPAAGGAVCWNAGGFPSDCVAWGNFTGGAGFEAATGTSVGSPVSPGGITAGMAIRRKITPGCATFLENADDTNVSATDFDEVSPAPRNNGSPITEHECSGPDTSITSDQTGPGRTDQSDRSDLHLHLPLGRRHVRVQARRGTELHLLQYAQDLHGAERRSRHAAQIRSEGDRSGTRARSDSGQARHGPSIPRPPTASIGTHPTNPSPGANPAFKYTSNESPSTFKCRLSPTEASFSSCPVTGKTYSLTLADGEYTFEVIAIDQALNAQSEAAPTTYHWTVSNTVPDTTPPETPHRYQTGRPERKPDRRLHLPLERGGLYLQCSLDGELLPPVPRPG